MPAFCSRPTSCSLLQFLAPHASFFTTRRLDLATLQSAQVAADFDPLIEILMAPGDDTPATLIDALFIVHELAGAPCEDEILDLCRASGIDPSGELSTTDLLMQLWLRDREGMRELHRRQATFRPRSFVYFTAIEEVSDPAPPSPRQLADLRIALDNLFCADGCGTGLVVHEYIHEHEWWFIVRHGERMRKVVGRARNGTETTYCFHPEKLDVVIYDVLTGELRINARTKTHRKYYCRNFGFYLFGSFNFFPGTDKYTLTPVLQSGPACLRCEDVAGIHRVRLVGLKWVEEERDPPLVLNATSKNVFTSLIAIQQEGPPRRRLLSATFRIYFSERDKTGRSVIIREPNIVQYTRDGDSALIEQWMHARGFINLQLNSAHRQHEFTMA